MRKLVRTVVVNDEEEEEEDEDGLHRHHHVSSVRFSASTSRTPAASSRLLRGVP